MRSTQSFYCPSPHNFSEGSAHFHGAHCHTCHPVFLHACMPRCSQWSCQWGVNLQRLQPPHIFLTLISSPPGSCPSAAWQALPRILLLELRVDVMFFSGTIHLLQSVLLHGDRMLRPGSGSGAAAMLRQTQSNTVPYTTLLLNIAVFVVV